MESFILLLLVPCPVWSAGPTPKVLGREREGEGRKKEKRKCGATGGAKHALCPPPLARLNWGLTGLGFLEIFGGATMAWGLEMWFLLRSRMGND